MLLGGARLTLTWNYPDFWLQRDFFCLYCLPLPWLRQGFCLSLSLPGLFPWGVYKRQRLAIYPVSVITSLLENKLEADYKFLGGAHLSPASGNAERRLADCEIPAWSLSIAYCTTWRLCKYWASFHLELFSRRKNSRMVVVLVWNSRQMSFHSLKSNRSIIQGLKANERNFSCGWGS